jgi:homopolymeric O-antigen transport system permease protein
MIEYEIKSRNKFSLGLQELWQYKELFYFFTWRDVKVKYKQAALGFLWAVLQPLAMMLVFTLIFSKGLNVKTDGNIPYPVFAISGLLIWNIFSNGLLNSANSMVTNANIIKKIYFPRLVVPLSSILVALVDFCFALLIFFGIILFFRHSLSVSLLRLVVCLPLSIILTVITTFGLGTFLSALNVKYRDFQYVVPFLIQFLLFVNPVLYSSKLFKNTGLLYKILNLLMQLNPIAGAINLARAPFLNVPLDWILVLVNFCIAFVILIGGVYTFRKTEAYFADLA